MFSSLLFAVQYGFARPVSDRENGKLREYLTCIPGIFNGYLMIAVRFGKIRSSQELPLPVDIDQVQKSFFVLSHSAPV